MQIKKKKKTQTQTKKTQQLRELKVLVRFSIENDSTLLITAGFVGKEKNVISSAALLFCDQWKS